MIIVKLTGGLGNQLFQYAMGYTLAKKNKTSLKLDVTFFESYEWHAYSLSPFNIAQDFASKKEIDQILRPNKFISVTSKIFRPSNRGHIIEDSLRYNETYTKTQDYSYLDGYWQCEEYFKSVADLLRNKLKITVPPTVQNQALINDIQQNEAVSLHIRRGNYVSIDAVNKVHGTCTMDYYTTAIKYMVNKFPSAVFYIFSDDIAWAKQNLITKAECVFVDLNDDKSDYEDLRLMQSCKHHILANSTFSWWGAWLNPNVSKTIIAPQTWFNDVKKNEEADTLIPKNWIRL